MSAPTFTMREPRLVPENPAPGRGRGRVQPNPALPNLITVTRVGSWPVGAIVPKEAFPHGFRDHLELGVVVETDRPATHGTALGSGITPHDESAAEVARLRGVCADYEGKLAALQAALVERDTLISSLRADVAAAEEMLKSYAEARELVESAGAGSGLVAIPAAGIAPELPKVAAPWTAH